MILKDSHFEHLEPNPKISKTDTVIETLQRFKTSPKTHVNQIIMSESQQNKKSKGRDMTTKQNVQSE